MDNQILIDRINQALNMRETVVVDDPNNQGKKIFMDQYTIRDDYRKQLTEKLVQLLVNEQPTNK